ncbi:MAG: homoserine kinase [Methylophilaceae bacterium]|jgi:homoserine kinase type II|nr:homoserine kinase [Methyloradius sp.]
MSVFTTVTPQQLSEWLKAYPLGELLDLQGIASGITNTNYFVTTSTGRYVLTLFEANTAEELPYFLDLMAHLAQHQVLCPSPVRNIAGNSLGELNGKPAALVSCLKGRSLEVPAAVHCAEVGRVLAAMHIAGDSFSAKMENPRGANWRLTTGNKLMDLLSAQDRALLQSALSAEAKQSLDGLPTGVIHADLFRDNVLFDGEQMGGVIDFYYACNDVLLYDVAIAVNDWCTNEDGSLNAELTIALLKAYHAVRPFSELEHQAWPNQLMSAALRFWLSRLYDFHFPNAGELTHAKDPAHFQKILQKRINEQASLATLWI